MTFLCFLLRGFPVSFNGEKVAGLTKLKCKEDGHGERGSRERFAVQGICFQCRRLVWVQASALDVLLSELLTCPPSIGSKEKYGV